MRLFRILISFILFPGCLSTSLPPVAVKEFVLEEDEKRLWRRAEEEQRIIDNSGLIYRDEDLETYLNDIARKIQPPEVLTYIPFKVKVVKNHLLNAFAFPNGVVYIHTGLLARMDNEAQLATLLAHETTHSTHRHAIKTFRDIKNKTAFQTWLQATLTALGGFGVIGSSLGALGTLASVKGYSRELETEADIEGLKRLIEAGYDPEEAPKLFVHLKNEVGKENVKEPFFFGTHPRLQERIGNYDDLLKAQDKAKRKDLKNAEVFLDKIHKVILENANLNLKAGRFDVSQKDVQRYLILKPHDPKAYCLLGEIFRQKGETGDLEKAIEFYKKAISINQSYPEPHKGMGMVFFRKGEWLLAKQALEFYLSLAPDASDKKYIEGYLKKCGEGGEK